MNFQNTSKQKGFTLIELIIVIIILGILAVTAAPKFLDVQKDAQESAISGIAGAVRSASQIAHAANLITAGNSVTLEGDTFVTSGTYLVAGEVCKVIGLLSVAQTVDQDPALAAPNTGLSDDGAYTCDHTPGVASTSSGVLNIYPGAVVSTTCVVSYTDNLDDGAGGPAITVVTTGC